MQMLLSHLKTRCAVQLTLFWSIFSCLLSTGSLCSCSHTLKYKAATFLDVTTSQPYTLPLHWKIVIPSTVLRIKAKAFHWQFKLGGDVHVGGSSTDTCSSLSLQADSHLQQNCKMDSCEHEYLKSWQRHLAELVCHSPMAERLVGSVGSAGRGLLERGAGKLRPTNPLQTTGSKE